MKKNYKLALLAALGLATCTVSQAQSLYLGFNDAAGPTTAQNDYVINLGAGSQFTTTSTVNLSGDFFASSFNTAFGTDGSAGSDVAVGVVGASATGTGVTGYAYQSAAFVTGFPSGSSYGNLVVNGSPTAGEYSSASQTGWSWFVAASPTAGGTSPSTTWAGTSIVNPMSYLSSGIVTESLYEDSATTSGRTVTVVQNGLLGTFTINVNTDTITYSGIDAAAVPESGAYGLLAGAGLLVVSLRRQLGFNYV